MLQCKKNYMQIRNYNITNKMVEKQSNVKCTKRRIWIQEVSIENYLVWQGYIL